MRDGVESFGLHLNENEVDLISKFMNDVGVNGELTVSMFKDLVKAVEMELPEPGEFATHKLCLAHYPNAPAASSSEPHECRRSQAFLSFCSDSDWLESMTGNHVTNAAGEVSPRAENRETDVTDGMSVDLQEASGTHLRIYASLD